MHLIRRISRWAPLALALLAGIPTWANWRDACEVTHSGCDGNAK